MPFAYDFLGLLRPSIIVELGTHFGDSFFTFCQSCKEHKLATKCYAIDSWIGDEHAGFYGEDVYQRVVAHNDMFYKGFSNLIKSSFNDALNEFSDNSISLLHIDGCHSYEEVKNDFDKWIKKVEEKGVVFIHDIMVRTRDFGVWKFWEEIKRSYQTFELTHGNGLGVVFKNQVNKEIEESFLNDPFAPRYYFILGDYIKLKGKFMKISEDYQKLVLQNNAETKIKNRNKIFKFLK